LGHSPKWDDYFIVAVDRFNKCLLLLFVRRVRRASKPERQLKNYLRRYRFKIQIHSFHTQVNGYTKVVNTILVHLLKGYNNKHPKTWMKAYIQHENNRTVQSSIHMKPFEVCSDLLPQSPIDMARQANESFHSISLKYLTNYHRFCIFL